jgi:hypothetical protein
MLKMILVGTIAKGFILRQTAATEGDYSSPAQIIGFAVLVHDLNVSFNFKGAV